MSSTDAQRSPSWRSRARGRERPRQKALTIGAVCKALHQEFPDISISKIRYLEDQKLLTPRRTPGGLPALHAGRRRPPAHDPAPAARRVPAAAGDPPGARGRVARSVDVAPPPAIGCARGAGGRASAIREATVLPLEDVARGDRRRPQAGRELEEYGVDQGRDARRRAATTTRPSARSSARSPSWRATASAAATCASFAPRPTARRNLLQQILAPALRSRNPRAAQGGGRGAREPRRGGDPPQAPAADPRPAQDRHLSDGRRAMDLRAYCPRHPRLPPAGDPVSRTSRRCCWTPGRSTHAVAGLAALVAAGGRLVVAAEARGFILGAALARELGAGFVPARKPGKLPQEPVAPRL